MIKTAVRLALVAASFAAAQAHAVTVNFTGIVTAAYEENATAPLAGETITGAFTFDGTAPAYDSSTDGSTYATTYSYDYSGTNALQIKGFAKFSDGTVLLLDTSAAASDTGQYVYRNYAGALNQVGAYADTYTAGNYSANSLQVYAYDLNGALSSLFANPSAGLTFSQAVNTGATDSYFGGSFSRSTTTGYYYGYFDATSLTISPVPESSKLALLLGGLGLVGFAARRRQMATRA